MRSSNRKLFNMIFALMLLVSNIFLVRVTYAADLLHKTWIIDRPTVIESMIDALDNESSVDQAFQWNNVTFVPARALANQFELSIEYIKDSQEIIMKSSDMELRFSIKDKAALVLNNQGAKIKNVNSYLIRGVAYIPLRFSAESLNLNVAFDEHSNKIEVSGIVINEEKKFEYFINEDLTRIIDAIFDYNRATLIKLTSNDASKPLTAIQRKNGMGMTMDIIQDENKYQVIEQRRCESTTGNIQITRGIYEFINDVGKPKELLGGESVFNIGDLGVEKYQFYCITELTKENIEDGYRYNIKKIGDSEVNISIFINGNGQISRYIICGLDGNIIDDFTVEILE